MPIILLLKHNNKNQNYKNFSYLQIDKSFFQVRRSPNQHESVLLHAKLHGIDAGPRLRSSHFIDQDLRRSDTVVRDGLPGTVGDR